MLRMDHASCCMMALQGMSDGKTRQERPRRKTAEKEISFLFNKQHLAVLVYRCLHGSAPGYLASDLQHMTNLDAHRRMCSSSTSVIVAPRTLRATIGDCAFPTAAASVWNSMPESVQASPSLPVVHSRH